MQPYPRCAESDISEAALSGGSLSIAAVFAFILLGLSFTRCHAAFDNGMEARRGRCNFHVDVHPGRAAPLAALDETSMVHAEHVFAKEI